MSDQTLTRFKNLGYYNGTIGSLEEMTIPLNDCASFFGDGVYDAGPVRNRRIFALDEHVDRFFNSAHLIDIEMPVSKDELKEILNDLVQRTESPDLFLYYQVTRGTGIRKHVYPDCKANLWVTCTPATIKDGVEPVALITYPDKRFLYCHVKTLNLIPSVLASEAAAKAGAQEAIFYRNDNHVTECAHSNVHILKDGTLITHPTDEYILPGIARKHLISACNALKVPVEERIFSLDELFHADEVIVTSSSNLCLHANMIDNKSVGGKDPDTYEKLRVYLLDEFIRATQ